MHLLQIVRNGYSSKELGRILTSSECGKNGAKNAVPLSLVSINDNMPIISKWVFHNPFIWEFSRVLWHSSL